MKKLILALVAAMSVGLLACNTVHSANVEAGDVVANGTPVAVVAANSVGVTLIFHFVPIIDGGDFDSVVNKTLVAEAKAMGGNKVEIIDMMGIHPDQFPMSLSLVNPSIMMATGLAVK